MKRSKFDAAIDGIIAAGAVLVAAMFIFIHYLGGWGSL